MNRLNLIRPLVFIDTETTGLDLQNDRIIELAMCKINIDGSRDVKCFRYYPEMPIPTEATAIHGIKDEDVALYPRFKEHARTVLEYIADCDLAGYNSNNYDFPLLFNEFARAGHYWNYKDHNMIDVCNIFKIREARTLAAAVKFYCGKDHSDAHSAEADILASVEVLEGQLKAYEDLPTNISELALYSNHNKPMLDLSGKFTTNKDGVIVFAFGQNKDKLIENHLDYLRWMRKSQFPADTNEIIDSILNKTVA